MMSDSNDESVLLRTAVRLARLGGRMAADRLGQARTTRKADDTFLTQVDGEIQEALLGVIAEEFSGHAILAEEHLANPQRHAPVDRAEYCWVIDPLDGTRNFSRALPIFATSVAVMREGWPILGAICEAMTGQVFSASAGRGATLDGHPIHVCDNPADRDTIIAVRGRTGRAAPAAVHRWTDRYILRNVGAAALHLAFVAAGMVDAAYNAQCKLWDIAAGALLVTEAGGLVTTLKGEPIFPLSPRNYHNEDMRFLAAGSILHSQLLPDAQAG
jgi:myo-inositol-1(or 4)-monophosphatase